MGILVNDKILPNVKLSTIITVYNNLVLFFMDLKSRPLISPVMRIPSEKPKWAAEELLFLVLYGFDKRSKFKKNNDFLIWNGCPMTFEGRLKKILGPKVYGEYETYCSFIERQKGIKNPNKFVGNKPKTQILGSDVVVDNIAIDEADIQGKMNVYIEDFDLHCSVDRDILRNYVITQMLIERAQLKLLRGGSTSLDVNKLTDQLKNYIGILGLSKKDRRDLDSERKKGSIAELTRIYEDTLETYPDLEEKFLFEELDMLLNKYNRVDMEGNREISITSFKIVSGGYSIEEARSFVEEYRKRE